MTRIFLFISVMVVALPLASALDCFKCVSMRSMQDCVDFQKETRCVRETDRCRNMTVQVYVNMLKQNVTAYQRGCATQDQCLHKRCSGHFAEEYGEKENAYNFCNMSCCKDNLCPQTNVTANTDTYEPAMGARGSGSHVVELTSLFVSAVGLLSTICV